MAYESDNHEVDDVSQQQTAFRLKEKKYQLFKEQTVRYRNGKKKGGKPITRPTDYSDVIDVDNPIKGSTWHTIPILPSSLPTSPLTSAYSFDNHPGLIFIRNALTSQHQHQLISECLSIYPDPPSTTNFSAVRQQHNLPPLPPGLWSAAQQDLHLISSSNNIIISNSSTSTNSADNASPPSSCHWGPPVVVTTATTTSNDTTDDKNQPQPQHHQQATFPTAKSYLKKLRWATLGPPFNWTTRQYDTTHTYRPLPDHLSQLAIALTQLPCFCRTNDNTGISITTTTTTTTTTNNSNNNFKPNVALVNYYRQGDTLGGHKDDAEKDMTQPIVTLSLGSSAIFLMGGERREEEPTALLVRSGDALILGGPARRCYHGVPRILENSYNNSSSSSGINIVGGPTDLLGDEFERYMEMCRINISIRQVD